MDDLQFQAEAILHLSRRMYESARQGEWPAFIELEERRRQELEALFAQPGIQAGLAALAGTLEEVMRLDAKSMALGEQEKRRLSRDMDGRRRQRRAAQVYRLAAQGS